MDLVRDNMNLKSMFGSMKKGDEWKVLPSAKMTWCNTEVTQAEVAVAGAAGVGGNGGGAGALAAQQPVRPALKGKRDFMMSGESAVSISRWETDDTEIASFSKTNGQAVDTKGGAAPFTASINMGSVETSFFNTAYVYNGCMSTEGAKGGLLVALDAAAVRKIPKAFFGNGVQGGRTIDSEILRTIQVTYNSGYNNDNLEEELQYCFTANVTRNQPRIASRATISDAAPYSDLALLDGDEEVYLHGFGITFKGIPSKFIHTIDISYQEGEIRNGESLVVGGLGVKSTRIADTDSWTLFMANDFGFGLLFGKSNRDKPLADVTFNTWDTETWALSLDHEFLGHKTTCFYKRQETDVGTIQDTSEALGFTMDLGAEDAMINGKLSLTHAEHDNLFAITGDSSKVTKFTAAIQFNMGIHD